MAGARSARGRGARTRIPRPNQGGGLGARAREEKVAKGHKVAALLRLAESDLPKPVPKWQSVFKRVAQNVGVPPGVLVRQKANYHLRCMVAQKHSPAGARTVLLEDYGIAVPTKVASPASPAGATTPATPATLTSPPAPPVIPQP